MSNLLDDLIPNNPFKQRRDRQERMRVLLQQIRNEDGKSPFDELVVDFLEVIHDELINGLAI